MNNTHYEVEPYTLFSESHIWQLNRDFYQNTGIDAWSKGLIPHQLTSNSFVGRTYAELILGFLKDLAANGDTIETVYILELGAGHGRLAFHILKHLEKLTSLSSIKLPPYCYVLSDIVEDNLDFFKNHPQLKTYYDKGLLDYAYYDAIDGTDLHLRHADTTITKGDLAQPILAIGNYFFDSIPSDVFHIRDKVISACSIAMHAKELKDVPHSDDLHLKNIRVTYQKEPILSTFYKAPLINEVLEEYRHSLSDSYVFFPEKGMTCIDNLKALSQKGLMLLSMDKGFKNIADIDKKGLPDLVKHGSFSLWVNYHALGAYCEKQGGLSFFPQFATFHLQVGCMLFTKDSADYTSTKAAYTKYVDDFGPDDINSIKKLIYENMSAFSLIYILTLLRLSYYDSSLFLKLLPRIKEVAKKISYAERNRLSQTLDVVWEYYFDINESTNLAQELAGLLFDLGYYQKALVYYQHSTDKNGHETDTYYNTILCHYQLRQDALFTTALDKAETIFPDSKLFEKLHDLDLNAV